MNQNSTADRCRRGAESSKQFEAAQTPTTADLHWAAGFLEGEGTFHSQDNGRNRFSQVVSATQVESEPLAKMLVLFGGTLRQYGPYARNKNSNPYWLWTTSGARARGIAMTLYPLLSVKRQEQIEKMLEH